MVLTSLLAIIGIMFVMAANMDKMTTSSVSINKELNFAVDSVVAEISQKLIEDVPGMPGAEYYDYPDGSVDQWLANLEPDSSNDWRHITDLYGEWGAALTPVIIPEHKTIPLDNNGHIDRSQNEDRADADGDGVADSRWTILRGTTSNKGRPLYAAIRIIDNGAMLNVNTGLKFNSNDADVNNIDGSKLWQVNLLALTVRPPTDPNKTAENKLLDIRANNGVGTTPSDLAAYERDVTWQYCSPLPVTKYTPFDISDELELRNRFLLNNSHIDTRVEGWGGEFRNKWASSTPFSNLTEWFHSIYCDYNLTTFDPNYAYRHIATTYSFDRIIDPNGRKMASIGPHANLNSQSKQDSIFTAIGNAIDPNHNLTNTNEVAAQITANLVDYCDSDSAITVFNPTGVSGTYYGFEHPFVYISELACKIASWQDTAGNPVTARSYAIELFKPYDDAYPDNKWRLQIGGDSGQQEPINWTTASKYHVFVIEATNMNNASNTCTPNKEIGSDVDSAASKQNWPTYIDVKATSGLVELQREVPPAGSNNYITVDSTIFQIPVDPSAGNCLSESVERDIDPNRCVKHLWSPTPGSPTLGKGNNYSDASSDKIPAYPANKLFTNIGEIGKIFKKSPYTEANDPILPTDKEVDVRVNLTNSNYQRIFDYLTWFDPDEDNINNDNDRTAGGGDQRDEIDVTQPGETPELKIPGRININTAPWYVIAQLPGLQSGQVARNICTDRDSHNGFSSVGELMNNNIAGMMPVQTPLEQRDSIFSRLSNLVTVRSDVFTAYILVRLGTDGPQKRVIAILDRSDVYPAGGKVKIVALWPVPDSR